MARVGIFVRKHRKILTYAVFSMLATAIDGCIVWFFKHELGLSITLANTVGVSAGCLVHYLLASKKVFDRQYNLAGFTVYLGTFFVGLGLSNLIIWLFYDVLFAGRVSVDNFLISKGIAALIPFYIVYELRVFLYRYIGNGKSAG